jgi:hypothetical protein
VKLITELVKVALLLTIAVLLGFETGIFQKPLSTEPQSSNVSDVQPATQQNSRKEDLRGIMEHALVSLFKFPTSVRFQNTEFEYNRLFHDAGIKVDTSKELEMATLCGQYSAPNAMGVYGAFEPFYAEVSVNNTKRGITGELWFRNDGKIQQLIALDLNYPIDGEEDDFQKLYSKNCGEADKAYMGTFSSYEIGYEAMGVKHYVERIAKLSQYPDVAKTLPICMQTEASFEYCIAIEDCQRSETLESNREKFCSLRKKICSDDDSPKGCETKIMAAYKEKSSKKKE